MHAQGPLQLLPSFEKINKEFYLGEVASFHTKKKNKTKKIQTKKSK